MGRMILSICAVVVALGLVGAAPQPQPARQADDGATAQQIASALERIAASQEREAEPAEIEESCAPTAENRNSDLCAQWKAADAASDAAFWAMAGFWVGLVTIGALGGTIWQGRNALAKAREANEIARSGRRAWVYPDNITLDFGEMIPGIFPDGSDGVPITVKFDLMNSGEVPALRLIHRVVSTPDPSAYSSVYAEWVGKDLSQARTMERNQGSAVAPGHKLGCAHTFVQPVEKIIHNGRFTMVLAAIIVSYRTGESAAVVQTVQGLQLMDRRRPRDDDGDMFQSEHVSVGYWYPSFMT